MREQAEELLAALKRPREVQGQELDPVAKQEQQAALEAAWGWYKEWRAMARTPFTRGAVFVSLGLRQWEKSGVAVENASRGPAPSGTTSG